MDSTPSISTDPPTSTLDASAVTETLSRLPGCWGSTPLVPGQTQRWQTGPLSLWLSPHRHELRVASERSEDAFADAFEHERDAPPPPDSVPQKRLGLSPLPQVLHLTPALADRPIVARPEEPFFLPPGGALTVYISSPLWIRLEADDARRLLVELPTLRPSDTWFGPSTIRGELCYASRTSARLEVEDVPRRTHRAITAVTVRNRSEELLQLERIKLPVEHLSLFVSSDGAFWTQTLTLERGRDHQVAMSLGAAPLESGECTLAALPRLPGRSRFARAFQNLLG